MNSHIKISVIVPVFNTEKYLSKCIDSIINQKYTNLEIIIINDGSTDSSKEIIENYSNKDNRIITIHKENGGIGSAYNIAFKIMTGDYIAFVDSDDYIKPDFYYDLVQIVNNFSPDIIHFGYAFINENENIISVNKTLNKLTEGNNKILNEHFQIIKDPSLACRLFKKSILDDTILFDQNVGIDEIVLPQALIKCQSIVYINNIYYYAYVRINSVSRANYSIKKIEEYIKVHRFICELFEINKPEFAVYSHIKYINHAFPVFDHLFKQKKNEYAKINITITNDINKFYQKLKKNNNLNKLQLEYKIKCIILENNIFFYPLVKKCFWVINIIKFFLK